MNNTIKNWSITGFVIVALAVDVFGTLIFQSNADPTNPGGGFDFNCPDASGDYLGNPADGSTFPTCHKLPTATSFAFGTPNTRSVSAATAYQATDNTKAAAVAVNLTSTASISLSGGTTNTAAVYISATNTVGTTGGTLVCSYSNSNTGTLTIGLNLSTVMTAPCTFGLPAGWYFAYRVSAGTVTSPSASDQAAG